ncbi:MAG TPA: RluA family pseudouridine synthase [Pirellulales bacterium]|jgi:23S rRNA pseudouridine1911/1915/1917 synthase|nr:RluA family pseudouridine synthase [Pirellulales bacterium]
MTVVVGERLLAYLFATVGLPRKAVKNLLKYGAVAVNGATVRQFDHWLAPGDEVVVSDLRSAAASSGLESAGIQRVYEDDALVVLDKPPGLLTVATEHDKTDTLFFRLSEYLLGRDSTVAGRPLVVHRLDHGTSGLVLFAKSSAVKVRLQDNWSAVQKTYWAVVEGQPRSSQGTITSYLTESKSLKVLSSDSPTQGARLATTFYRLLQSRGGLSLLAVRLATGRKHQIRVHLAGLGHPVVGDHRYGAMLDPCQRLALHAGGLSLAHPLTGEMLSLVSPLPESLGKLFPALKCDFEHGADDATWKPS